MAVLILVSACHSKACEFEPCIYHVPCDIKLEGLESPFPPLNIVEKKFEWGRELEIGLSFAKEMDLYRAQTAFKRALILIPREQEARVKQIEYSILLTYYLAGKYQEVVEEFEKSSLFYATPEFPAYSTLLVMLEDAYYQDKRYERSELMHQVIEKCSPDTAADLNLSRAIKEGELSAAFCLVKNHHSRQTIEPFLDRYCSCSKSVKKAQWLNAVLPGAGYAYVGQRKTAMTSFVLNVLFTAAAYQFFDRGYVAAGIFTTSLEFGWYFGGINGAGLAAKEYNERVYSQLGRQALYCNQLFPVMTFEFTF